MHTYTDMKQALKSPDKVKSLFLNYDKSQGYEGIEQLRSLEQISLRGFSKKQLPSGIGTLKELKNLSISRSGAASLPDWLYELTQLEALSFSSAKLKQIPSKLSQLKQLKYLNLSHNQIRLINNKVLPAWQKLEVLNLAYNQLEYLPNNIKRLQNLRHLDIRSNQIQTLPATFFEISQIQKLELEDTPLYSRLGSKQRDIKGFFLAKNKAQLDAKYSYWAWHLLTDTSDLIKEIPPEELLRFFNFPMALIRQQALHYFYEFTPSPFRELEGRQTLKLSSTGKIKGFGGKVLRETLQARGIQYNTRLVASTTHLIVGENPHEKKIASAQKANIRLVAANHVIDFLTQRQGYLNEHTPEAQEMTAHVSKLLQSSEVANQQLALQIIQGGGIPEYLFYDLLAIFALSAGKPEIKRQLEEIFQSYLPIKLFQHIQLHGIFREAHINFEDYMEAICQKGIDPNQLSINIYRRSGRGAAFCLRHPKSFRVIAKEYLRRSAMFLNDFNLKKLPETIGEFTEVKILYLQDNDLKTLPDSLQRLERLHTLNLAHNDLKKLPSFLGNFSQLLHLNLENNLLAELPKEFAQLKRLRHLVLNSNNFRELPETLFQLSSLETLKLGNNPIIKDEKSIKSLKAALPSCLIILD